MMVQVVVCIQVFPSSQTAFLGSASGSTSTNVVTKHAWCAECQMLVDCDKELRQHATRNHRPHRLTTVPKLLMFPS